MHLFSMKGAWGPWSATLYETIVTPGMRAAYEDFARRVLQRAPEARRAIDVGCGAGQLTRLLARRLAGCEVLGVDLSATMVQRAQRRAPGAANLRFEVADAQQLPQADASYDLAVSAASVKHWPEPLRGLQQLWRVLRPGGLVAVGEVDRACTPATARRFAGGWRFLPPGLRWPAALYFRRFVAREGLDRDELAALLRQAGFVAIAAQQVPEQPFVIALGQRPGHA